MVVIDHADAGVALLVGDRPSEERIGARALGKNFEPARAFGFGARGWEVPVAHGLRVAKAGVEALKVARIEAPQAQALGRQDGMGVIFAAFRHGQSPYPLGPIAGAIVGPVEHRRRWPWPHPRSAAPMPHALPIKIPAANTMSPPTTTSKAARRNFVSM